MIVKHVHDSLFILQPPAHIMNWNVQTISVYPVTSGVMVEWIVLIVLMNGIVVSRTSRQLNIHNSGQSGSLATQAHA